MKKILLLGATGFIGKNVLIGLIKTYPKSKIICIHFKSKQWLKNKNVIWKRGDLRNPNFFRVFYCLDIYVYIYMCTKYTILLYSIRYKLISIKIPNNLISTF